MQQMRPMVLPTRQYAQDPYARVGDPVVRRVLADETGTRSRTFTVRPRVLQQFPQARLKLTVERARSMETLTRSSRIAGKSSSASVENRTSPTYFFKLLTFV